jgi:carboxymethylenebutenolidase
MPEVEFESNGGTATGYLSVPEGGGPGTIVLQEWWGVDDHIRGVCDRLAGEGFVALAPDLFGGKTTDQPDEAQQLMMALSMDQAEKHMRGAVDYVAAHESSSGAGVGSVGYCLGGGLSVWAASANPKVAATVTYYYVLPHGKPDFSKIKSPVLGHFGTRDEFVSADDAKALEAEMRQAGIDARFEFYDAGHAFFNDTNRLGTYDPEAAELSWRRTLEFFRANLG